MRFMRSWVLAVAPAAMLSAGCGLFQASERVDDNKLAHLPARDREAIVSADRSIDVARQNVATASVGLDEAQQFRTISNSELDAAKSRMDASKSGVKLGQSSYNKGAVESARADERAGERALIAARAKKEYAERLVALRNAQKQEAEAELVAANAGVEDTKAQLLQRNNMTNGVDVDKIANARIRAQQELAEQHEKVAQLQGEVQSLQGTWDRRRNNVDTASRGSTMKAPAAPKGLPNSTAVGSPTETPSAPASPE